MKSICLCMQVSTNETFAEFRKAAKEKAEKERGLKEQQVSQSLTLFGMLLRFRNHQNLMDLHEIFTKTNTRFSILLSRKWQDS